MVEVKRKKGETFDSLLRRFSKKIQHSGRILQAKKIRFYQRQKSRNRARQSALQRLQIRGKMEYLTKIGKIKENVNEHPRRRRQ